jgi:hypothetical protein
MIPLKNFGSSSDASEGGSDGEANGEVTVSGKGGTGGNTVVLDGTVLEGAPGPNAHHSQPTKPPAMTEKINPILIKYRLRILPSILPNSPPSGQGFDATRTR